jgi:hypothetical protein
MQKISFKKWLETAGTFGIVSCKDLNNPNFQIWGALSDLNCKRSKHKQNKKHRRLTKRKK